MVPFTMCFSVSCLLFLITANVQPLNASPENTVDSPLAQIQAPAFFQKCLTNANEELIKLLNDISVTRDEMRQKVDEWLPKQSADTKVICCHYSLY